MEISLEKVDKVRERTGVSYGEAKKALEMCEGNVLDAIIFLEEKSNNEKLNSNNDNKTESVEEFKQWLKELINKGNVSRIKVSKDDKVLVDVPVNAGIAAGVIAIIIPPILAFVVVAAVVTQVTIEITKTDGSVEVVNKYISKAVSTAKNKATDIADIVKEKVSEVNIDGIKKRVDKKSDDTLNENTFTYTVNFDEDNNENN